MAWFRLRPAVRKFLQAVAISAAVAILTTLFAFVISYLLYPVSGIEVRGARMFPESEAWEATPNKASLLLLTPDILEKKIESNPWVKSARVIKDWESGIVAVEVKERTAVLDGNLGSRRIVLAADGTELPGLGGANLKQVVLDEVQLEEILKVSWVLEKNGAVLDSIDAVSAGGVEATVKGHHVLFGGEVGDGQARALVDFLASQPDAAYFDLRSPGRVVIGSEEVGKKPDSRFESSDGTDG
ncbi:MAG: FtsQ-type POTRA domain-containing protein [Rubrobacter sp.]|nr:FtsQ-type POTRA domain-containing protein [Rubrobacter sp.]